eukprot:TRINITY_DN2206_c2_g1_i1.p2 TRINITY_DN2206_c2_g1~~TRINITY_DN2206_c2_g1_i1.p2  ORF type:complete len:104 (-),score=11.64 TRINITY_DN2206_c2_g1_i1:97-408(-)
MIPVNNTGSTALSANMALYRRKADPIVIKVDDGLQYDVEAKEIDKGEEVVNKRYADENLVQRADVVKSGEATSDEVTTYKALNRKSEATFSKIRIGVKRQTPP